MLSVLCFCKHCPNFLLLATVSSVRISFFSRYEHAVSRALWSSSLNTCKQKFVFTMPESFIVAFKSRTENKNVQVCTCKIYIVVVDLNEKRKL